MDIVLILSALCICPIVQPAVLRMANPNQFFSNGIVESPGYDGDNGYYENNQEIRFPVTGTTGKMSFQFTGRFGLEPYDESSCYDHVDVLPASAMNRMVCDASNRDIGHRFCGDIVPPSFVMDGTSFFVDFCTDSSYTMVGFQLQYTDIDANSTAGNPSGSSTCASGSISTLHFNNGEEYTNNIGHRWILNSTSNAPATFTLHFNSTFDVESISPPHECYDYVAIRTERALDKEECFFEPSDSDVIGVFCGYEAPSNVTHFGEKVIVEFCSDDIIGGKGFQINWSVDGPCEAGSSTPLPGLSTTTGRSPTPATLPTATIPDLFTVVTNGPIATAASTIAGPSVSCGIPAPQFASAQASSDTVESFMRIVGGVQAQVHSLPWTAAIMYGSASSLNQYCGATLITPQYLVSAAHCFYGESTSDLFVKLGANNNQISESSQQVRTISQVTIHPEYMSTNEQTRDIAVVKLSEPVTLNDYVGCACLPSASDPELAAETMTLVSGWGLTTDGGDVSATLQQVGIPIVSRSQCQESYGSDVDETMICGGFAEGGKDSCQGDSGGPLVWKNPTDNKWYLRGVVSWGAGCAEPNYPGVYARVTKLVDWIVSTMASNEQVAAG